MGTWTDTVTSAKLAFGDSCRVLGVVATDSVSYNPPGTDVTMELQNKAFVGIVEDVTFDRGPLNEEERMMVEEVKDVLSSEKSAFPGILGLAPGRSPE